MNEAASVSPCLWWLQLKSHCVPPTLLIIDFFRPTLPGELFFEDTPFGRITAVICMDADFPSLIRAVSVSRSSLSQGLTSLLALCFKFINQRPKRAHPVAMACSCVKRGLPRFFLYETSS